MLVTPLVFEAVCPSWIKAGGVTSLTEDRVLKPKPSPNDGMPAGAFRNSDAGQQPLVLQHIGLKLVEAALEHLHLPELAPCLFKHE